jgi:NADH:ubiquinone oxidoreductase subunit E
MVGEAPTPAQTASDEERAAVDAVLDELPTFSRTLLLPTLQAVQVRHGHLTPGLLGYLGQQVHLPFADVYGVASFYALLSSEVRSVDVRLCNGVPCVLAGAELLAAALRQNSNVTWSWFPCIGQCDRAPAALVDGEPAYALTPSSVLEGRDARH